MRFEDYPIEYAELIWAYSWLCMNFDHSCVATNLAAVPPARVRREAKRLLRYLRFMKNRGVGLANIRDSDNDAWMALFRGQSHPSRVRASSVPKRLHIYRDYLDVDMPAEGPWRDREANEVLGKREQTFVNTTNRVPRSIMDPMLRWALLYVDVAFEDVLRIARGDRASVIRPTTGCACIPGTNVSWRSDKHRDRFRYEQIHLFVTAAYIVTAYLSGMRDCEVQAIRRGSARVKRDEEGNPYRHSIVSMAFKRQHVRGVIEEWVVLPEVHRALERVEKISDLMRELEPRFFEWPDSDLLFRRYSNVRTSVAAITIQINQWLRAFEKHATLLASDAIARAKTKKEREHIARNYLIPVHDYGRPWNWISRNFRRTIAWYIATEPFGVVAGKRQFGHVQETTFQGYAGSWKAGFRDEIEVARQIGKTRDIVEMYAHVRNGGTLGGPKGKELADEFRAVAAKLGDLPGQVVDEKRLLGMLKNATREIYPGLLNDCYFDRATALCLHRPGLKGRDKPYFAQCDWEKCPNSCFWGKHRAAFQSSLEHAQSLRKRPKLSKNQRTALDVVIAKYRSSLSRAEHAC